jgi:O-antigen biosynthesis protein
VELPTSPEILVSVVIVNYRVPQLLLQTLRSLRDAEASGRTETIVVDNCSQDNSAELVSREFPDVKWISLKSNIGFGKACNVAAQNAHGVYLLFLNPDTIIAKNTLVSCIEFMEQHPTAGLVGPKILNADGSLQVSCRRSFPTVAVAFYRIFGLSKLFPHSRRFGRYNLTFMDPNQPAEVEAISGSFMFMRLPLFRDIGGFDERFFMYGEDLDLCRQTHDKGYSVWYNPATQIIHFKGKSSSKRPIRSRASFYEAMILFSRKYHNMRESFLPGWLIYIGIFIQASVNIGANLLRSLTATYIDIAVINLSVWIAISLRFVLVHRITPYHGGGLLMMTALHLLITVCFLASFAVRGVYSKRRYSRQNALVSGFIASVMFMTLVYFVQSMAFSRIAFGISVVAISFLLVAWRQLFSTVTVGLRRLIFATGNVIIMGNGPVAEQLLSNMERDRSARISGIIWPSDGKPPAVVNGYPVLGTISQTRPILERERVDMLLIATAEPWYSFIIEALASATVKNLTILWVPHDLLIRQPETLPEVIPLQDFTV